MGVYINPTNGQSKKKWLEANGARVELRPIWPPAFGTVLLSWVDNGLFDALGVCYSKQELEACQYIDKDPTDGRPHFFFSVSKDAVMASDSGLSDSDRDFLKAQK